MDVYKLYATGTADTDAAASLDIQVDGHIVAASLDVWVTGADALNDGARAEVSFASTSAFGSNDTKASILHAASMQGFLTSGGGPVQSRSFITGVAIEVAAGERMYLHVDVTGTMVFFAQAYLYVMAAARGGGRRDLARRR